jgi:hypothetical protein
MLKSKKGELPETTEEKERKKAEKKKEQKNKLQDSVLDILLSIIKENNLEIAQDLKGKIKAYNDIN